jgi:hypothetical protein
MSVPAHPRTTGTVVRTLDQTSKFEAWGRLGVGKLEDEGGTDERPRSS